MSGSLISPSRRQCLFVLAAAATFATSLPAQQPQANIRSITRYRLKPERAADFRSLVKDINAVLKKFGHNQASTWWAAQSGRSELVVVGYLSKWSEMEGPSGAWKEGAAELAPLQARAMQCLEHSERIIDVVNQDLSLPRSTDIPAMISNTRLVVKPERVEEFLALEKSELLPAVQKSGLKTFLFARTRYGAPSSEFRMASGMKGWADLDGPPPIVTGFGGDGPYQKYLAKVRPMLVEAEYTIYRHIAELDYTPSK